VERYGVTGIAAEPERGIGADRMALVESVGNVAGADTEIEPESVGGQRAPSVRAAASVRDARDRHVFVSLQA
jgi:hypothetical protein